MEVYVKKSRVALCSVQTDGLDSYTDCMYRIQHIRDIHFCTIFVVTTGLLVFKLRRSHFYLSAFSRWSLSLCGRGAFHVLLRHVAGALGQTPDE